MHPWEAKAIAERNRFRRECARRAQAAAIAGIELDLESWAEQLAARSPDTSQRALLLASAAGAFAEAGRTDGARSLARQAVLAASGAGVRTMLQVLEEIIPVLTSAGELATVELILGILDDPYRNPVC